MLTVELPLTDEQERIAARLAAQSGMPVTTLIREIVAEYLAERAGPSREEIKRKALAAIGAARSGVPDLGSRHDYYLTEARADERVR